MNPNLRAIPGGAVLLNPQAPATDEQKAQAFLQDLVRVLVKHEGGIRAECGQFHTGFALTIGGLAVTRIQVDPATGHAEIRVMAPDEK